MFGRTTGVIAASSSSGWVMRKNGWFSSSTSSVSAVWQYGHCTPRLIWWLSTCSGVSQKGQGLERLDSMDEFIGKKRPNQQEKNCAKLGSDL